MKTISLSCLLIICSTVMSQEEPPDTVNNTTSNDHSLQIGLAAVNSQSVYIDGSQQSRIFPAIDYKFKQFYFQAGDVGYQFIKNKKWEFDFGLGVNLAGDKDRGDSPMLRHLPQLSLPVNAFLASQYKTKYGVFKLKYGHEINNKHDGHFYEVNYSAPIFKANWLIIPQLSYEHHSKEAINYFYGVSEIDATNELNHYAPDAANNLKISVLGLRKLNAKWSFISSVQNIFLGDEISNSPIVDDDQRISVFFGFLYKVF